MKAARNHATLDSLSHFALRLSNKSLPSPFKPLSKELAVGSKTFKSTAKTLASLLRQCDARHLLPSALSLHAHSIKSNRPTNTFSYNIIISTLCLSGEIDTARKLFNEMLERNVVTYTIMIDAHMKHGLIHEAVRYFESNPFQSVISYTAMINGLVRNGLKFEALLLFRRMICDGLLPNEITFTTVIRACVMPYSGGSGIRCSYQEIDENLSNSMICDGESDEVSLWREKIPRTVAFLFGESVVGLIVKTNFENNLSVCNSLITMYLKMGDGEMAKRVFDDMIVKDVVSWTAILDVYFEMGDLKGARQMFNLMPVRNEVSWSMMIARLSHNNEYREALSFFKQMVHDGCKPNISCFASVLSASACLGSLVFGTSVHSLVIKIGFEINAFVSSSLIDMYSKCGKSQDARQVFDLVMEKNIVVWNSMVGGYGYDGRIKEAEKIFKQMPERNIVSWNAMISCYDSNEQYEMVLRTFNKMLVSGQMPTPMTFSSVLHASANLPSLEKGKNIHGKIVKQGLEREVFVGTALIDMYSKSGDIESSKKVFFRMPEKNEVTWTAMIQGLADYGFAEESLNLFEELKKTSIIPTEAMFLTVICACSHCGLVDKGFKYFETMEKEYGILPKEMHYTCMVDLLARAGYLREAEEFIGRMPSEPEAKSWAALLSGCCTYGNEEIGKRAAEKLWQLGKGSSAAGYVLLSNIYASGGKWKDAAQVRISMKEAGVKKGGGYSWIQIRDQIHSFYSWDANHPQSSEIYGVLELFMSEMVKF